MTDDDRNGAERIVYERRKQVEREGWTKEHDAEYDKGEMAMAAACYAAPEPIYKHNSRARVYRDAWPWGNSWDKRKKHNRIRQLEIAGALIAAEIDRLLEADHD